MATAPKGVSWNRTRRRGSAALALGIALVGGGCATLGGGTRVERKYQATYTFTIAVDGSGCPKRPVEVDGRNCDPVSTPPPDCVHTRNKDTVRFRWAPAPAGASYPGFQIQFSPFKNGAIASTDAKPAPDGWLQVEKQIDAPPNPGKPYPFSIVSNDPARCPRPVDPQIIVDW